MTQQSLNPITVDKFLNGRLIIRQPKNGYRTGMDAVLLAAAVPAGYNDNVLEVGTGVGTAMLCLAMRVQGCHITGIEIQQELAELAQQNILQNKIQSTVKIINGDLNNIDLQITPQSFSHVITNPPYFKKKNVTQSLRMSNNIGKVESLTPLKQWISFCLKMLKSKGILTLIFTASRLDELMVELSGKVGNIILFPIWSKAGQPAKRFIVQGVKNHHGPTRLSYGLVVHENDGTFTASVQALLRQGNYLKID